MNLIYSVPHTGTRFTMALLDHLGVSYLQRHSDESLEGFDKVIVPLRDPAVQFLSLRKRSERQDFEWLLAESNKQWQQLTDHLEGVDPLYLKIDGVVDFENPDYSPLYRVAEYVNSDQDPAKFGWPVVHSFRGQPTSYSSLHSVSKMEREVILGTLEEHRNRYGYNVYSLNNRLTA